MLPHPLLSHPLLRQLAAALAANPGTLADVDGDPARAAVALTLRVAADETPELLLIQRAIRARDPWSGQIALPGGRASPNDESLRATAIRETVEETGVNLTTGLVLGTLDELRPRTPTLPPIIVTPFVAVVDPATRVVPNYEVAAAFWVPIDLLRDPTTTRESTVEVRGARWRVPSLVIGDHVVWGMTERILRQLLTLIG